MRLEHAVRVVKNLRRYQSLKSGKTQWFQAGPYVPQNLILKCTKAQQLKAEAVMSSKFHQTAIRTVDVRKIRSFQHCLRFRSLMWNVKNAGKMQKVFRSDDIDIRAANLPTLVYIGGGVYVLWNGNHRTTACILHGKTHIVARCCKATRSR